MNAMPGAVAQQSLRHGLRRALQLLERLGDVHGGVVLRPEPAGCEWSVSGPVSGPVTRPTDHY